MTEFQYTTVLGKLPVLMEKIRTVGVPPKATTRWLESIGFKSNNDRTMIKVLVFIGFLDETSVPTDIWQQYREAKHQKILASAIKEGYSELFDVYPAAWECSTSELESFFTTRTTAGKQVITKTVSTFTTLCSMADFSENNDEVISIEKTQKKSAPKGEKQQIYQPKKNVGQKIKPSLNINIQIHISPSSSPEQIDQIFASMSKHLSDL